MQLRPTRRKKPASDSARAASAKPVQPAQPARPVRETDGKKPLATGWGAVSAWYDKLLGGDTGTFQKQVILPGLIRLMALKNGDTVVDLACGQGFFAAAFMAEGASVIGVDVAEEQVLRARENAPGAEFHVSSATDASDVKDGVADHVTVVLAMQNIEDAHAAIRECARVLKPGGKAHIVLNHPAFRIPKRSSWGWDKENRQYRRVDGYLTESRAAIDMHPGATAGMRTADPSIAKATTFSFHRPMQFYVKAFVRSGMTVSNMEEWISHKVSDSGPRAPEENRARREFPLFLYIEATKA